MLYIYTITLFKKEDVELEYKMYYVDKILSDYPGPNGLSFSFNEKEYLLPYSKYEKVDKRLAQRKGKEFKTTNYGAFNTEDISYIYYKAPKEVKNAYIKIEVTDIKNTENTEVLFNSNQYTQKIGEFNNVGEYEYKLPLLKKDEVFSIEFKTKNNNFTIYSIIISERENERFVE